MGDWEFWRLWSPGLNSGRFLNTGIEIRNFFSREVRTRSQIPTGSQYRDSNPSSYFSIRTGTKTKYSIFNTGFEIPAQFLPIHNENFKAETLFCSYFTKITSKLLETILCGKRIKKLSQNFLRNCPFVQKLA